MASKKSLRACGFALSRSVPHQCFMSVAFCALALSFGIPDSLQAQANSSASNEPREAVADRPNINITPKRLTFGRGERTITAYVFNQGDSPATFDISLVDRAMLPNGEIEAVSELKKDPKLAPLLARAKTASDLLLVTPRRATLSPGKGQTIRIRLKSPPPAESELRTHLTVTTIPPRSLGLTADEAAAASQGNNLNFQIASIFGISVPVIVRTGTPEIAGRISGVQLRRITVANGRQVPALSFELERTGSNSLYGNISVVGKNSKATYATVRGVGVYPEIDARRIEIPLQREPQPGETLDVKFVDDDLTPGRTIAESSYVVG